MSNTVISIENVFKQYRLGKVGKKTLVHDIDRWWHRVRGKEDPYLKIGETNDRTSKGSSDYVWALQDISFDIKQGEAVGIIGRNGAGKSTLLKILSKTTTPTKGSIKIKGRIASLLEVGTGFHPELSGRENIYLNGAILGMTKKEITKKFDEIVDFAGVERYIDTPVKRYSSGMYVRLAFGVAAHLEPEILIVDEVLAVGDLEFQKKCLGKMKDVSDKDGRTVLFVSHNMGAIKNLCTKGVYLKNGQVEFIGDIQNTVTKYLDAANSEVSSYKKFNLLNKDLPLVIESVQFMKNGEISDDTTINFLDKIGFELMIDCRSDVKNRGILIHCNDAYDHLFSAFDISNLSTLLEGRQKGKYKLTIEFPHSFFKAGIYTFDFEVGNFGKGPEQVEKSAIVIQSEILSRNPRFEAASANRSGRIYIEPYWNYTRL